MPGILSTILYCGMNGNTLRGFIAGTNDPRLGWDSYRRFIEHYAVTVLGIESSVFETVLLEVMKYEGVVRRYEFDVRHLETITARYLAILAGRGLEIPDDVFEQLRQSVAAIYASWSGERAAQFRKATKTSPEWGTSVLLMQMIPGNAAGGGASVLFTQNPFTHAPGIYGETRTQATGDDLALGRYQGMPLAKEQAEGGASLEETDPELFRQHWELAQGIGQASGGLPQEIELTYRREKNGARSLFVLQARRMELSADYAGTFDEICRMESKVIGRGIGACGGALSGVASFAETPEAAARLAEERTMPVILLRTTANTGDVSLMPAIRGIVTASGGATSHAAVLAQKFGVNAVVACSDMTIGRDDQGVPFALIGGSIVREGTPISIDGTTGLVFSGTCLHTTRAERN